MGPMNPSSFDLSTAYVHLGLGGRGEILTDFEWSREYLQRYERERASGGPDGRLVMIGTEGSSWTSWERPPSGDELVIALKRFAQLLARFRTFTRGVAYSYRK
jgi:hypothetical protein